MPIQLCLGVGGHLRTVQDPFDLLLYIYILTTHDGEAFQRASSADGTEFFYIVTILHIISLLDSLPRVHSCR